MVLVVGGVVVVVEERVEMMDSRDSAGCSPSCSNCCCSCCCCCCRGWAVASPPLNTSSSSSCSGCSPLNPSDVASLCGGRRSAPPESAKKISHFNHIAQRCKFFQLSILHATRHHTPKYFSVQKASCKTHLLLCSSHDS
jgi:hypothetical protein